jgi:hypothetical protein
MEVLPRCFTSDMEEVLPRIKFEEEEEWLL